MSVRQAILDDITAISELARAKIERWQRMNAAGQVEDLPYGALSIYERWLHGGAWMSAETGAIWLTHLVSGGGLPFVLVDDSGITAYAEAYISQEPDPFRHHLHIGELMTTDDSAHNAMMTHLRSVTNFNRLTIAATAYDQQRLATYEALGFQEIAKVQRVNLAPQNVTIGYYKVSDHHNPDAAQIMDWQMPIGRIESARYHWEQLWADLWQAVPRITERKIHRLHFSASGQPAFVVAQQQLYDPRGAEIFCWTPKAMSSHLLASIRDWSYKAGYRSLTMSIDDRLAQMLGTDFEATPHQHVILALDS